MTSQQLRAEEVAKFKKNTGALWDILKDPKNLKTSEF